ncbi:hypothetical protein EXIGLDRAFT_638326 [Exidia glandulosa HHB12029]|uniref:Uncharacterized protein n=1 Tax=Exidia glandulosa HHB12029 TaxID=1314781 RepID=A0A165P2S1_EXIGL|nr:hypothetical protein EXIGLDRAFT_638326 [Exidia glandulosa HHB12029]
MLAHTLLFVSFLASAVRGVATDRPAYKNPNDAGGRLLDWASGDLGEPLNVIISGQSSKAVLTDVGFLTFVQSIGFSTECLGQHGGGYQQADLGDGQGRFNQTNIYREDFGDTALGTCLETLNGGNHIRMWRQAGTGALFLAASQEMNLANHHDIVPNGYDIGRDKFVASAVAGSSVGNGVKYKAVAENLTGLLKPGADGVNHGIATDGVVVLLTVTIVA